MKQTWCESLTPEKRPIGYLLLVEDHDINQILIKEMTERLGYQTDLAVDGADAVAKVDSARAENSPFDLILMDIQMPGMDGYQATRMIRASGISKYCLPIVAITANTDKMDIARCFASGMQDHIAKPVIIDELRRVLSKRIPQPMSKISMREQPGKMDNISEALASRYLARKNEAFSTMDSIIRTNTFWDHELREISDHLHKLAGTAAMFGEAELGTQALVFENGIATWRVSERSDKIRQAFCQLRTMSRNEGTI